MSKPKREKNLELIGKPYTTNFSNKPEVVEVLARYCLKRFKEAKKK